MGTPSPATRRATATPSAIVRATGFSQNTGTPASAAATTSSGCASVAAATTTPSTPEASSSSGVAAASTPNRSTTERMAAGTASVTTSEVTDESLDSVSAWKAPIRPSPIKPIFMAAPRWKRKDQSEPPMTAWSQSMIEPVTTPLRSDKRKTTKSAISSTWPNLPMGTDAAAFARQSSSASWNCRCGSVLALRVGPADVKAVDADAVPPVRVCGVARRSGEPGFGCDVRGEVGLTAELGDRDDVDDCPGRLAADHVSDDSLHREVRAAQIHRDVRVEQFGRRVEQRAARGQASRVDQAVDAAKFGDSCLYGRLGLRDVADVGLHEARRRTQLDDELLSGLASAARDDDLGPFAHGGAGDCCSRPCVPPLTNTILSSSWAIIRLRCAARPSSRR